MVGDPEMMALRSPASHSHGRAHQTPRSNLVPFVWQVWCPAMQTPSQQLSVLPQMIECPVGPSQHLESEAPQIPPQQTAEDPH